MGNRSPCIATEQNVKHIENNLQISTPREKAEYSLMPTRAQKKCK